MTMGCKAMDSQSIMPIESFTATASLAVRTRDDLSTVNMSALAKPSGPATSHQTAFSTYSPTATLKAEDFSHKMCSIGELHVFICLVAWYSHGC